MRIKLNVTKNVINDGLRLSPQYCPIGICLNRFLSKGNVGYVYSDVIEIGKCGEKFGTTRKMEDFIDAFDNKKPVKPQVFTINIPKKYLKV